MARASQPEADPEQVRRCRLGVRLGTVHWPVDLNEIHGALVRLKYDQIAASDESVNAQKNEKAFYCDHKRMVLGFHSQNLESVISSQREFFSTVKSSYGADLADYSRFYEVEYISTYYGKKSHHEALKSAYADSGHMSSFLSILGMNARPKGVDLVSADSEMVDDKWFHVTVEPKVEGTRKSYYCMTLFRDTDLNSAIAQGKKSPEYIKRIIERLERG